MCIIYWAFSEFSDRRYLCDVSLDVEKRKWERGIKRPKICGLETHRERQREREGESRRCRDASKRRRETMKRNEK